LFVCLLAVCPQAGFFPQPCLPEVDLKLTRGILAVAALISRGPDWHTVEIDNEPFKVISFSIMKQAGPRSAAKTTIKLKFYARHYH
jgi:hypothetical protein